MASIFKRNICKNEPYTIQYKDQLGRRTTEQHFTDKGLPEQLADKLESEARLRRSWLIDAENEELAERKWAPIKEHLVAFEESVADNSASYVRLTMSRVRRIVDGCGLSKFADIEAEAVQSFLRGLRKAEDLGHRT